MERSFGPTSPENTPQTELTIDGIFVENYFAPETKLAPIIAERIAQAQNEILFLAFSYTNDEIGEAMLDRLDQGVTVRGVFETVGSETEYSYYMMMLELGPDYDSLSVRQDGNSRIMHHKVIIIDREIVIFGSFNFSDSANRSNDENIIIIHDPTFANFFVEEFEFVWREAAP